MLYVIQTGKSRGVDKNERTVIHRQRTSVVLGGFKEIGHGCYIRSRGNPERILLLVSRVRARSLTRFVATMNNHDRSPGSDPSAPRSNNRKNASWAKSSAWSGSPVSRLQYRNREG